MVILTIAERNELEGNILYYIKRQDKLGEVLGDRSELAANLVRYIDRAALDYGVQISEGDKMAIKDYYTLLYVDEISVTERTLDAIDDEVQIYNADTVSILWRDYMRLKYRIMQAQSDAYEAKSEKNLYKALEDGVTDLMSYAVVSEIKINGRRLATFLKKCWLAKSWEEAQRAGYEFLSGYFVITGS